MVTTEPRLPDGTPFPTTFYLTCPRAASRIGTLEGSGLMKRDERAARRGPRRWPRRTPARTSATSAARAELGEVPEIDGVSAGGMPDRVKCLHVLAAQALAQGRGVNPLGDEVLDVLGEWWATGPCVDPSEAAGMSGVVAAIDCGTNTIKLLVGDLPRTVARSARCGSCGSARAWTDRPARPTRRWRGPSPRSTSTPR